MLNSPHSKDSAKVVLPSVIETVFIDYAVGTTLVMVDMRFKRMFFPFYLLNLLLTHLISRQLVL